MAENENTTGSGDTPEQKEDSKNTNLNLLADSQSDLTPPVKIDPKPDPLSPNTTTSSLDTKTATSDSSSAVLTEEQISNNKAVVDEIRRLCRLWRYMGNWFNWGIGILGGIAICSSVFVSIFTGIDEDTVSIITLKIFAFISTLSLTLLTAFNLMGYSNNSRKAWRSINVALMRYDAGLYTIQDLISAYQVGEDTMGTVNFTYAGAGEANQKKTDDTSQKSS